MCCCRKGEKENETKKGNKSSLTSEIRSQSELAFKETINSAKQSKLNNPFRLALHQKNHQKYAIIRKKSCLFSSGRFIDAITLNLDQERGLNGIEWTIYFTNKLLDF